MSEERLAVRVTISFFEDLDRQLRPERGPLGQPSRADFQAFELVEIIDAFATGFDQLPELIAGRAGPDRIMDRDYRVPPNGTRATLLPVFCCAFGGTRAFALSPERGGGVV